MKRLSKNLTACVILTSTLLLAGCGEIRYVDDYPAPPPPVAVTPHASTSYHYTSPPPPSVAVTSNGSTSRHYYAAPSAPPPPPVAVTPNGT